MREVIAQAGRPLAAPSANRSGRMSPTEARHVGDALADRIDLILDGGRCAFGVESTVVRVVDEHAYLLRPGAIPRHDIETVTGPLGDASQDEITSPGRLARHYAPRAPLRLNATTVTNEECLLAFGAPIPGHPRAVRNLSARGDLTEAAANLFAHLHALDKINCNAIAAMTIPDHDLGEAINDRLRRAAQGRGTS
jgi:L-threonylcarbamoyladenylate synthase